MSKSNVIQKWCFGSLLAAHILEYMSFQILWKRGQIWLGKDLRIPDTIKEKRLESLGLTVFLLSMDQNHRSLLAIPFPQVLSLLLFLSASHAHSQRPRLWPLHLKAVIDLHTLFRPSTVPMVCLPSLLIYLAHSLMLLRLLSNFFRKVLDGRNCACFPLGTSLVNM